ncbi:TPA: hypothetical protein DEP21_02345 [Patescibacteria group bacterium]|nr:hypothetical protein [Candidatus Gracilibacteria bacterium]
MVKIEKNHSSNQKDKQCMVCTTPQPKVRWTLICPSKQFFEDAAAWVSQIANSKNIVRNDEKMAVEMCLCEHHEQVMNRLLPHTKQSPKDVLGAFQYIIEVEKN